jgi:hypothetical protein
VEKAGLRRLNWGFRPFGLCAPGNCGTASRWSVNTWPRVLGKGDNWLGHRGLGELLEPVEEEQSPLLRFSVDPSKALKPLIKPIERLKGV